MHCKYTWFSVFEVHFNEMREAAGSCGEAALLRRHSSEQMSESDVMFESYDAAKMDECLDDWSTDEAQRSAALASINALVGTLLSNFGDCSADIEQLRGWATALRKFSVRHQAVANLNRAASGHKWVNGAPVIRQEGDRRTLKVDYEYKAGGEKAGRRYVKGAWYEDNVGAMRCNALAGMPGDLRAKLTGAYYYDIDGVASDFYVFVNLATQADLPPHNTNQIRSYLTIRDEWHSNVAKYYLHFAGRELTEGAVAAMAACVKRWPNKLANSSGYHALIRDAGLPSITDVNHHEKRHLLPLAKELRLLKTKLLHAECNRAFVELHTARFERENPGLNNFGVGKKVFSLLVQTEENKILQRCVEVTRRLNRAAMGDEAFMAQPIELRDSGALVYDGCMCELHPAVAADVDDQGRQRLLGEIERELASIGVEYRLATKPNFGLQDQPVESAVRGRAALKAAVAAYPSVRAAVDSVVDANMDGGSETDDDQLEALIAAAEAGRGAVH
jgi:hypothetical protein